MAKAEKNEPYSTEPFSTGCFFHCFQCGLVFLQRGTGKNFSETNLSKGQEQKMLASRVVPDIPKSCVTMAISAVLCIGSIFGIVALAVYSNNKNNPCQDVENSSLALSYVDWLAWFGATVLSGNGIAICVACAQYRSESNHYEMLDEIACNTFICVVGICQVVQFILYIIGSLLFVQEIYHSCPSGESLYEFGLTLMIVESVGFAISACLAFGCGCVYLASRK